MITVWKFQQPQVLVRLHLTLVPPLLQQVSAAISTFLLIATVKLAVFTQIQN